MIYPSLIINKKTYRGQIDPLSVFNAICAGFKTAPSQCDKTLKRPPNEKQFTVTEQSESVTVVEIVLLVLFVMALNAVLLYLCRRKARREMQNEMNM